MISPKLEQSLVDFTLAVASFKKALAAPMDQDKFMRDAAIQRFEFTLEVAWKTTKTFLSEVAGIDCRSPKGCLRDAFTYGLIKTDDPFWFVMVDLRNEASHTYNETRADELYQKLPGALERFENLLSSLQTEVARGKNGTSS